MIPPQICTAFTSQTENLPLVFLVVGLATATALPPSLSVLMSIAALAAAAAAVDTIVVFLLVAFSSFVFSFVFVEGAAGFVFAAAVLDTVPTFFLAGFSSSSFSSELLSELELELALDAAEFEAEAALEAVELKVKFPFQLIHANPCFRASSLVI